MCCWPARAALALYQRVLDDAVLTERPGLWMHVAARAAQARLTLGDTSTALGHVATVRRLWAAKFAPFDIDRSDVWWIVVRILRAHGDEQAADELLAQGTAWLQQTARDNLALDWRERFLHGHPGNRRLLNESDGRICAAFVPTAAAPE